MALDMLICSKTDFAQYSHRPLAERGFVIDAAHNAEGTSLVLRRAHREVDLLAYLPPRHGFVQDAFLRFHYDAPSRQVFFPAAAIMERGFLVSLFYEIGHAWHGDHVTEQMRYGDFHAMAERRAWAYGLRALRSLRRDGFDAFAEFGRADNVHAHISLLLATYEWGRAWRFSAESYTPIFEKRAQVRLEAGKPAIRVAYEY